MLAIVITWAFGLPTANAQTFDLSDATELVPVNVKAAAVEYKGRKGVVITRDAFPPLYGLYGRRFRHRVYALPRTTRAATLGWLDARSIGYVYVRRPSAQDAWFRADRRFRLLFADSRIAAYATPFGRVR